MAFCLHNIQSIVSHARMISFVDPQYKPLMISQRLGQCLSVSPFVTFACPPRIWRLYIVAPHLSRAAYFFRGLGRGRLAYTQSFGSPHSTSLNSFTRRKDRYPIYHASIPLGSLVTACYEGLSPFESRSPVSFLSSYSEFQLVQIVS